MKPSTREWVVKAEEDFATAQALARPRKKPLWGRVGFHIQQCIEKYLKARLNESGTVFSKTHALDQLLNQTIAVEPLWSSFQPALKQISDFAVQPRYPGFVVTKSEATKALKIVRAFRKEARASLGLK